MNSTDVKIWFISDFHFGHKNIINFERTNFESIEQHDDKLVKNFNNCVRPNDIAYILGDIGNFEKVKLLNGRKILILGNHDPSKAYIEKHYPNLFEKIYSHPVYLSKRIVLSHEPIIVGDDILNVHGHLHGSLLDLPNYYNVSAREIQYMPVSKKAIDKRLFNCAPKHSERFLLEWYAKHYKFTQPKPDIVMDENMKIKLKESRDKFYNES